MREKEDFVLTKRTLPNNKVVYYYYSYDEKGKRIKVSTGQKTKTGARAYCNNLMKEGKLIPPRNAPPVLTFEKFAHNFWSKDGSYAQSHSGTNGELSTGYLSDMSVQLRFRVMPKFGPIPLAEISPYLISKWLQELRIKGTCISQVKAGEQKGKALEKKISPTVIKKSYECLRRILGAAVQLDLIPSNPADKIDIPKVVTPEKDILSEEQLTLIFGSGFDTPIWVGNKTAYFGAKMSCFTGLRVGEVVALRWENVLDTGQILINQASKSDGSIGGTKTGKSRDISIPLELLDELKEVFPHTGFVFSEDGVTPVNRETLSKPFTRVLKELGMKTENLSFHSLRHTFNSLLAKFGVEAQDRLKIIGHTTTRVNQRYLHLPPTIIPKVMASQKAMYTRIFAKKEESENEDS